MLLLSDKEPSDKENVPLSVIFPLRVKAEEAPDTDRFVYVPAPRFPLEVKVGFKKRSLQEVEILILSMLAFAEPGACLNINASIALPPPKSVPEVEEKSAVGADEVITGLIQRLAISFVAPLTIS